MQTPSIARRTRRAAARGFTLVEILIVVIILGILAAIVIPQFTSASEDARKNSVTSQLQTIRSQVELYKLQHRDKFPTADGNPGTIVWSMLTQKTNAAGTTNVADGPVEFGPYLQAEPVNGLNGKSAAGTVAGTGIGFVMDANGKIFATGKVDTTYYDEADRDGDGITDEDAATVGFTAHGA